MSFTRLKILLLEETFDVQIILFVTLLINSKYFRQLSWNPNLSQTIKNQAIKQKKIKNFNQIP